MKDEEKTKKQLINELMLLRQRIAELEKVESERKPGEEALRNSQERLNLALKSSKAGTWDRDIAADKATWDEHLHALFGLVPGTFSGKLEDFLGMVHPDDRERVRAEMTAAVDGDADYGTPFRVIWPDFSVHFIASRGKVYRDSAGLAVRMIGVSWDVTEQKQAEEALRESEGRYRQIAENIREVFWMADLDLTRMIYVSPAYEEVWGQTCASLYANPTSWMEAIHPADRDKVNEFMTHRPTGGHSVEYRVVRSDGSTRWVLDRGFPIRDQSGTVYRIAGIAQDITERKQAEEALRESEERFRSFMDNSPTTAWIKDEQGRYVYLSKTFKDQHGIRLEEWQGKTDFELWPLENAKEFWKTDLAILDSGQPFQIIEVTPNPAQGIRCWWKFKFPIRDASGKRYVGGVGLDITERKRAEETLREYEKVVEGLEEMIAVVDQDYRYLIANRAFLKYRNQERDQVIGCLAADILGKEVFGKVIKKELDECFQGNVVKYDMKYSYPEFGERDLFITYLPIEGPAGVDRVACVVQDITDRKRAEEEKTRLALIVESSADAIIGKTLDGEIATWNRGAETIYGYTAEEIIGQSISVLVPDNRLDEMPAILQKVGYGERIEHYETIRQRKDGQHIQVSLSISPIRDISGRVIGASSIARDITERKRAEEASERLRRQNELILNSAGEGILGVDLEGKHTFVNPAASRMLGFEAHELIGHMGHGLYHHAKENGEPCPEEESLIYQAYRNGKPFPLTEGVFWRKDGTSFPVRYSSAPLIEDGKVMGAVVTFRDITERKALESKLIQAQKMEAIGTLAGGIAHDFNNILAAIVGYSEIIKRRFDEPTLNGYLERILSSCDRAKSLVAQILTFSRATQPERRPIDMASLVKEALKLLRATLPSTIRFRQKIAPGAYAVLADPTQIHQVLINLCTNAAHAMRERGGVLEVSLDNVEITPQIPLPDQELSPGAYVKLTVGDTGTGIASEVIQRIFDPFFTTKMTGEGTGLGLSVVYGIVKTCGGAVRVQSELGVGSVLTVYLPEITYPAEGKTETSETVPGGSGRILFVDDEEILVKMWCDILENLGYNVTATTESARALELFRSQPDQFDLVITDMTMPGMTGIDLSREILELRAHIPIILCTGFNELVAEENAKRIGIREFAMKPLNLRSMAELVRKALEKKAL